MNKINKKFNIITDNTNKYNLSLMLSKLNKTAKPTVSVRLSASKITEQDLLEFKESLAKKNPSELTYGQMCEYKEVDGTNGQYYHGLYYDRMFKVIIDKNGYVNGPKMCKGTNKRFDNWLANDETQKLIAALKRSPGIPGDLYIIINTGSNDIRGTYLHPKLIIHLAMWISQWN